MLAYSYGPAPTIVPERLSEHLVQYAAPDCDDFAILKLDLAGRESETAVFATGGPCVALIEEGSGRVSAAGSDQPLSRGQALLLQAGEQVRFEAGDAGLRVYMAKSPERYFEQK